LFCFDGKCYAQSKAIQYFMLKDFTQPQRVVITGFGCVTPVGIGREAFWQSLKTGRSGVSRIESFDVSASKVKIEAEIKTGGTFRAPFRWRWLPPAKR